MKKLHPTATIPYKSSRNAAGYDLTSTSDVTILPGTLKTIWTRIAVQIPHGYYGQIVMRSSVAKNGNLTVVGGVVDSDYTGDIGCILFNLGDSPTTIAKDERFAQLVIIKIHEGSSMFENDFTKTERGEKGFGSTGKFKQSSMFNFLKKAT